MRWLTLIVVLALTQSAAAASRKVLVLPVDGTADAATRAKLTTEITRFARTLDGQVAIGTATFADTALAVGCDPRAIGCSDAVIATLGVDELIWGTASKDGGQTRLTVRRAAKGGTVRDVSTTIAAGESGDRIASGIAPLFGPAMATPEPAPPGPASPSSPPRTSPPPSASSSPRAPEAPAAHVDAAPPPPSPAETAPPAPRPAEDRRDRTIGITMIAGGGLGIVVGLALWGSYAGLQTEIDDHPTRNRADLDDLKALEDRAGSRAIAGDLLVVAGLAVAGIGGYYLYRDHKRHAIAIAPAPVAHGTGLTITITIRGGL